jgi:hypothetical protein
MYERAFASMGERSGVDPFALYQRYGLRVNRPMPDVLKPAAKVDALDALLDRVRSLDVKDEGALFGPSLTEFLRKGGVKDMQGELAGRDLDKGLKPFQRKLVRDDGLAIDKAIEAATQAGYFPEGEVDVSQFLDAIDQDTRGTGGMRSAATRPTACARTMPSRRSPSTSTRWGWTCASSRTRRSRRRSQAATGTEGQVGDVTFEQVMRAIGMPGTIDPLSGELSQEMSEGKRGRITFGADRQFNIELLEQADLSDVPARDRALLPRSVRRRRRGDQRAGPGDADRHAAPDDPRLRRRAEWLGVSNRAEIGVEQHEQWARGIEAYLRDGKAPSAALRSVFAKFRTWLINIYQSLTQLHVNLSPEVRQVMDRLLATDTEIETAEREAEIAPLFTDAVSRPA